MRNLLPLSLLFLTNTPIFAADFFWTNPAGGDWQNSSNWNNIPPNSLDAIVHFETILSPSSQNINLTNDVNLSSLFFNAPSSNYQLSGTGRLFFSNTGNTAINAKAQNSTVLIDNDCILNRPFTIDNISDMQIKGSLSGNFGIEKTGTGALTLSGNNTYTGETKITNGSLLISSLQGSGSSISVSPNTTLVLANSTIARSLSLGGRIQNLTGDSTLLGTLSLQGPDNVIEITDGSLTIQNTISGSSSLEKIGAGNLVLTTQNNLQGPLLLSEGKTTLTAPMDLGNVIVSGTLITNQNQTLISHILGSGTILFNGPLTFTVNGPDQIFNGYPVGTNGSFLTKQGSGSLFFTGQGQSEQGLVKEGLLDIGAFFVSPFTVFDAATLAFNNARLPGPICLTGSLLNRNGNSYLSGLITLDLFAEPSFSPPNNPSLIPTFATINVAKDSLEIFGNINGKLTLRKTGIGSLILSNNNNFSKDILVEEGTLVHNKDGSINTDVNLLSNTTLLFNAGNSENSAFNVSLEKSATLVQSSTAPNVSILSLKGNGTIQLPKEAGNHTFSIANTPVFNGTITGGHTDGSIIKKGSNSFCLTNKANSFLSKILVEEGTLSIQDTDTLGKTDSSTYNLFVYPEATLELSHPLGLALHKNIHLEGVLTSVQGNNTLGGLLEVDNDGVFFVSEKSPLTLACAISGKESLTKKGKGPLTLAGEGNNTFSGTFFALEGDLFLQKQAPFQAIPYDLNIDSKVKTLIDNQLSKNTTVTLNKPEAILDLSGQNEQCGSFNFAQGTFIPGNSLTIWGDLNVGNVELKGPVVIQKGSVVQTATGKTSIENINLKTETNFLIQNRLNILKSSGYGIKQQGNGLLDLSGQHAHTTASTLSSGTTHLTGHFSGDILVENTLTMDGSYESGSLIVSNGGVLTGSGSTGINSKTIIDAGGIFNPGKGIGTMTFNGPLSFLPGSTYIFEFEADKSQPNGSIGDIVYANSEVVIAQGAKLKLIQTTTEPIPIGANWSLPLLISTEKIAQTFSDVVEVETTVLQKASLQIVEIPYLQLVKNNFLRASHNSSCLQLSVSQQPFTSVFSDTFKSGNAGQVARHLDENNHPESNFALKQLITNIQKIGTKKELLSAFDQIDPSLLKALTTATQTAMLNARESVSRRIQNKIKKCSACSEAQSKKTIWTDFSGSFLKEKAQQGELAFKSTAYGGSLGFDYGENTLIGIYLSFQKSPVKWRKNHSSGKSEEKIAGLYGAHISQNYFVELLLQADITMSEHTRKIDFAHARTHGENHGIGALGHITLGLIKTCQNSELRPFISIDYQYLNKKKFKEKGASALDLSIKKARYTFLRHEYGLQYGRCFSSFFKMEGHLSYVQENRFRGENFRAHLIGAQGIFLSKGLNLNHHLFSPGIALSFFDTSEKMRLSFDYSGLFGKRHRVHSGKISLAMGF